MRSCLRFEVGPHGVVGHASSRATISISRSSAGYRRRISAQSSALIMSFRPADFAAMARDPARSVWIAGKEVGFRPLIGVSFTQWRQAEMSDRNHREISKAWRDYCGGRWIRGYRGPGIVRSQLSRLVGPDCRIALPSKVAEALEAPTSLWSDRVERWAKDVAASLDDVSGLVLGLGSLGWDQETSCAAAIHLAEIVLSALKEQGAPKMSTCKWIDPRKP